jgi:hypothetical protein
MPDRDFEPLQPGYKEPPSAADIQALAAIIAANGAHAKGTGGAEVLEAEDRKLIRAALRSFCLRFVAPD